MTGPRPRSRPREVTAPPLPSPLPALPWPWDAPRLTPHPFPLQGPAFPPSSLPRLHLHSPSPGHAPDAPETCPSPPYPRPSPELASATPRNRPRPSLQPVTHPLPAPSWPCLASYNRGGPRPRPRLLARRLLCPNCGLAPVLGHAHLCRLRPCPFHLWPRPTPGSASSLAPPLPSDKLAAPPMTSDSHGQGPALISVAPPSPLLPPHHHLGPATLIGFFPESFPGSDWPQPSPFLHLIGPPRPLSRGQALGRGAGPEAAGGAGLVSSAEGAGPRRAQRLGWSARSSYSRLSRLRLGRLRLRRRLDRPVVTRSPPPRSRPHPGLRPGQPAGTPSSADR